MNESNNTTLIALVRIINEDIFQRSSENKICLSPAYERKINTFILPHMKNLIKK